VVASGMGKRGRSGVFGEIQSGWFLIMGIFWMTNQVA